MTPAIRRMLIATATLLLAGRADAATYAYVGNPFTDFTEGPYLPSDRITGTIEFTSPLPADYSSLTPIALESSVVSYSFTDGHLTLNETNSYMQEAEIYETNSEGVPIIWRFEMFANPNSLTRPRIETRVGNNRDIGQDDGVGTGISLSPGVWTIVPEPSAAFLVGLGFAALTFARQKTN